MAKKVGVISINLTAGTAQFVADLDKANAKVRDFANQGVRGFEQFGSHSVSSMQATSGSLRLLEGNFTNNLRASERFITLLPGMSQALIGAFPLVGGLAFAGMLTELGVKVYDFFKKMEDAPQKVSAAFRELNAPLRSSIDEMRVANDRLLNEIEKLQGHRTNTLALTMDEARAAVDKLFDSIEKTIGAMNKLLQEHAVGNMQFLMGTADDKQLRELLGGQSGAGGVGLELAKKIQESNTAIDAAIAAKDPKALEAARSEGIRQASNVITEALKKVDAQLIEHRKLLVENEAASKTILGRGGIVPPTVSVAPGGQTNVSGGRIIRDERQLVEELEGSKLSLQQVQQQIPLMVTNTDLTAKKEQIESSNSNDALGRPFQDKMKALQAQLDGVRAKIAGIGQPVAFQTLMAAAAESAKIIEELNKALEAHHIQLSETEKAQIRAREASIKFAEADEQFLAKVAASNTAIKDRIASLKLMAAAIGQGYEATKSAAVETELMQKFGERYTAPGQAGETKELVGVRQGLNAQHDAQNAEQVASAVDKLGEQIELEKSLAAVQSQGAEAARLVTLAYRLRKITTDEGLEATRKQISAEIELYNAQRSNLSAEEVTKLNEKLEVTRAITAAEVDGAEAVRKAGNEARYSQMAKSGATPEVITSTRTVDEAKHQQKITTEALKTSSAYRNQIESLSQQLAVIDEIESKAKLEVSSGIDIETNTTRIRDLEVDRKRVNDEIRETMAKQALAVGDLKSGFQAFFTEIGTEAKKPGEILYESMHQAVDKLSDELTNLFTGQKTNWAKMFQGMGQQMLKAEIDSDLKKALGALGDRFPGLKLPGIGSKQQPKGPLGTSGDPLHVVVEGGGGSAGAAASVTAAPGSSAPPPPGAPQPPKSPVSGIFGGGSTGGMIFSLVNNLFHPQEHKRYSTDDIPAISGHPRYGEGADASPWTPPSAPSSQGVRLPDGLIDRTGTALPPATTTAAPVPPVPAPAPAPSVISVPGAGQQSQQQQQQLPPIVNIPAGSVTAPLPSPAQPVDARTAKAESNPSGLYTQDGQTDTTALIVKPVANNPGTSGSGSGPVGSPSSSSSSSQISTEIVTAASSAAEQAATAAVQKSGGGSSKNQGGFASILSTLAPVVKGLEDLVIGKVAKKAAKPPKPTDEDKTAAAGANKVPEGHATGSGANSNRVGPDARGPGEAAPSILRNPSGPTGEAGDPVHVTEDGGSKSSSSGLGGILGGAGGGGLGGILGILGGAGGGAGEAGADTAVDSSISFGGEASDFAEAAAAFEDGGKPPVGKKSLGGEKGRELFVPDALKGKVAPLPTGKVSFIGEGGPTLFSPREPGSVIPAGKTEEILKTSQASGEAKQQQHQVPAFADGSDDAPDVSPNMPGLDELPPLNPSGSGAELPKAISRVMTRLPRQSALSSMAAPAAFTGISALLNHGNKPVEGKRGAIGGFLQGLGNQITAHSVSKYVGGLVKSPKIQSSNGDGIIHPAFAGGGKPLVNKVSLGGEKGKELFVPDSLRGKVATLPTGRVSMIGAPGPHLFSPKESGSVIPNGKTEEILRSSSIDSESMTAFPGFEEGSYDIPDITPASAYTVAGNSYSSTGSVAPTSSPSERGDRRSAGGDQHIYQFGGIDARGADLGVENRLNRAIEQAKRDAVSQSVQAVHEYSRRTPKLSGR